MLNCGWNSSEFLIKKKFWIAANRCQLEKKNLNINHYTDFLKFGIWQKFGYANFLNSAKKSAKNQLHFSFKFIIYFIKFIIYLQKLNLKNLKSSQIPIIIIMNILKDKILQIGSKFTFRMYSGSCFYKKEKKKEENQLKIHLSNGIQEAIFTKKKE